MRFAETGVEVLVGCPPPGKDADTALDTALDMALSAPAANAAVAALVAAAGLHAAQTGDGSYFILPLAFMLVVAYCTGDPDDE